MYCLINVTYCHNFCPLILFSSIGYILFLYSRVFSLLFFSAFHCLNISQSDDNNSNEITAKQTVITIIQQIFLFLLFPFFFVYVFAYVQTLRDFPYCFDSAKFSDIFIPNAIVFVLGFVGGLVFSVVFFFCFSLNFPIFSFSVFICSP